MSWLAAALAVRAAAAWSDGAVAPQDCDALSGVPLQVLMYGNNDAYTLRKLDQGEWEKLFKIKWFDGHINAAAVFEDDDGDVYFFASFGGYLCRFDEDQKVCFDGQLKYSSPNAGVIVGATFYYSKNLGRDGGETIHFVTDIGSDSPTQVTSDKVAFSSSLFEGAVLDFAAVDEADGVSYVEDGDDDLAYLLGLGADFEVVVIRLDNDGHPDAYAVLDSGVEWGAGEEGASGGFGAAYMFKSDGDDAVTSVFFSSNGGKGTFQLDLGFAVDGDCWNEGTDVSGHTKCTTSQPIVRYEAASDESSSNDGLNCPFGVLGTDAPTALPTTSSPSYAPTVEKTEEPTPRPTHDPTKAPKPRPTAAPTYQPSVDPTYWSRRPSFLGSLPASMASRRRRRETPSTQTKRARRIEPTEMPTYEPSKTPTPKPSPAPTSRPSPEPSYMPSVDPTFEPTHEPSYEPTVSPTPGPSHAPSYSPTVDPTFEPTFNDGVLRFLGAFPRRWRRWRRGAAAERTTPPSTRDRHDHTGSTPRTSPRRRRRPSRRRLPPRGPRRSPRTLPRSTPRSNRRTVASVLHFFGSFRRWRDNITPTQGLPHVRAVDVADAEAVPSAELFPDGQPLCGNQPVGCTR